MLKLSAAQKAASKTCQLQAPKRQSFQTMKLGGDLLLIHEVEILAHSRQDPEFGVSQVVRTGLSEETAKQNLFVVGVVAALVQVIPGTMTIVVVAVVVLVLRLLLSSSPSPPLLLLVLLRILLVLLLASSSSSGGSSSTTSLLQTNVKDRLVWGALIIRSFGKIIHFPLLVMGGPFNPKFWGL